MPKAVSALVMVVAAFATLAAVASPSDWRTQGWKTDFSRMAVPLTEITPGGPPRDGTAAQHHLAFV